MRVCIDSELDIIIFIFFNWFLLAKFSVVVRRPLLHTIEAGRLQEQLLVCHL